MSKVHLEHGWLSMNKAGEQLCGDHVETVNRDDSVIMVLADGLGSGVKASILSTLTSKILATMLAGDMTVEDCVETIALTLPVCAVRQVAYCTFTILRVDKYTGEVYLVQFDNPDLILLREGKVMDYPKEKREIAGKTIYETRLTGRIGDLYIMMSDGAIHAGVGTVLNFGWQLPEIAEYAQRVWTPELSAKSMAAKISDACRELYMDIPGDDTTVAALRIRRRQQVNLMIGPPTDPAQDGEIMKDFFALEGKTIVCGGTTSTVVGRYLGKPVCPSLDFFDPDIPPIATIQGVDLVTEGVITLGRVVALATQCVSNQIGEPTWLTAKDGASLIARLLFEEATNVNFYVGRAMNPAHQNPDLPLSLNLKLRLVEELAKCLQEMEKTVTVRYY